MILSFLCPHLKLLLVSEMYLPPLNHGTIIMDVVSNLSAQIENMYLINTLEQCETFFSPSCQ